MATNSDSQTIDNLVKGKIKMHELDALLGENKSREIRIKSLEKKTKIELNNINSGILNAQECQANIENMIGTIQIPLGIAGPVSIVGEHAKGDFYIPLATTEGALVASVNRGCSIINKSGGASALILKNEQTRSILFKTKSINDSRKFSDWVERNFNDLKKAGEEGERFIDIKKIERYILGLNVWLRIKSDTKDAMGMNMITISGKKIADYITKKYASVEFISESGNMCTDKKPSTMNLINTRGKKVMASVDIPEDVLRNVLKTTSDRLVELNYRKNLLGSAASGSLGYNAHFSNMLAAIFIATGQDVAHVVDGSIGFTTVEKTPEGVNFSVTIPSLQVGTIGGGTGLRTQRECLALLGCQGAGKPAGSNSKKLAEIISVVVLAGEISLLGALCTKELSKAHMTLNR